MQPSPPAQETASSPQEQTKPQVLPVAQFPDIEASVVPAMMNSDQIVEEKQVSQPIAEPLTLRQTEEEPPAQEKAAAESTQPIEVALNLKRQAVKGPAKRVANAAKVEISPKAHSLNPCEQKKFSAAVKDGSGRQIMKANVTWETTDPKIATVNKKGVVTGVSPGYTFIRAVNGKIKSKFSSLFVRDKQIDRKC